MATTENVLVPLPGLTLPCDLPWRAKFVDLVEDHLRRLSAGGGFTPPRFFGYYFRGNDPVAISGNWTVMLDTTPALDELPGQLDEITCGQFSVSADAGEEPDFMLIHDRHDGACWLWRFAYGLRFVSAEDPCLGEDAEEEL